MSCPDLNGLADALDDLVPAVKIRPLEADDAAGIADLINEFDRAYVEDPDTIDANEVSGWWARIDRATDSRGLRGRRRDDRRGRDSP